MQVAMLSQELVQDRHAEFARQAAHARRARTARSAARSAAQPGRRWWSLGASITASLGRTARPAAAC
jgi:hypothetical protein